MTVEEKKSTPATCWLLTGQTSEAEPSRDIPLYKFPFRIGRRAGLECPVPSPAVSSLHAELDVDPEVSGGLVVRDLQSTNGTYVNGERIIGDHSLCVGDLVQFADTVFRLQQQRPSSTVPTVHSEYYSHALALLQFDKLMSERAVVPYYQPIVDLSDDSVAGYEVLGRSRLFGLTEPKAMFEAASHMNLEAELSRMMRWEGISHSQSLPCQALFLNTHPVEIRDSELLILSLYEARESFPDDRIVLEIHEGAVTDTDQMRRLHHALSDLQIDMAYDDFGAGQARLQELVEIRPRYVKFDMGLLKDITIRNGHHRRMLESLVHMVADLGIESIAEGVETKDQAEACREIGFGYVQGFYFGRPNPVEFWLKKTAPTA